MINLNVTHLKNFNPEIAAYNWFCKTSYVYGYKVNV